MTELPQAKRAGMAPLSWIAGRLKGRPDSEHEMSFNRLVFAAIIVLVLLIKFKPGVAHGALIGMGIYIALAVAMLGHIVLYPAICQTRRLLALVLDCCFLSWQLHLGGETVAVFFPIYLWVIFGNGFRFGIGFLAIAVPVATLSFGVTVLTTPFWYRQPHLSEGLVIGLIILPAYAGTLIRKLSLARRTAEEANKAKSLFLASVSHELRTPLTAIVGMSGLLRASELDIDQLEMLETIDVATRSLQSHINGLLDLSRIEAGRMPNQAEAFDLLTLLVDVRRMVESQLRAKNLRFDIHVTPRTPLQLLVNRQHLYEILVNLAGNAVKFTETGGIVLGVDGQRIEGTEHGVMVAIEVSDTGIGIAPQDQERIFENFTQANAAIMNRYGGTGLGLAITRQRVELMGGKIGVESVLGQGSTFRLQIRMEVPAGPWQRPALTGLPVGLFARNRAVAARLREHLSAAGVTVSVQGSARHLAAVGEAGQIMLVHQLDWEDAALSFSQSASPPTVVLFDEAAGVALPDRAIQKNCVAMLSEPLSDDTVYHALTIAMRLSGPAAAHLAAVAGEGAAPKIVVQPRRVLVVDDNRVNQRVFSRILESGGHEVLLADNGELALDILEKEADRLDLVLMDFNMPEMDGLEATKLFRVMSTGSPRLPIYGLTADATAESDGRWREAGMDGCLIKPVDPPALLAAIDTMARTASSLAPKSVTPLNEHPRFRPASSPALDKAIVSSLQHLGDAAFIDELMSDFLDDARDLVDLLISTARRGDMLEFRSHAHALRSAAANVGAVSLGTLCAPFVGMRGNELRSLAGDFAGQAEAELARTREAITALHTSRRAQNN